MAELAFDPAIQAALASGAVVAFSMSGGKDSGASAHATMAALDQLGHPRADRIAIHADLGRAEWKSTPETVERVAAALGLPLMVVRHRKHDMVSRWEARFSEGKRRYANLEVFNLIGPWSSASLRFCTAEMKQQVIAPALQKAFPGRTIISVIGIRREESVARSKTPISKPQPRWDQRNGTRLISWHPIVDWSTAQVFDWHARHGLPLHEAYFDWGVSRVSCAFCILQSCRDQVASARVPANLNLLHLLVDLEARSTFSFQPERWLSDAAPGLLPDSLRRDVARAKIAADDRRRLEGALPAGLRYVKGWPPRMPTTAEAEQIVAARRVILAHHDLPVTYPTATSVIDRFAELMAGQAIKAVA